MNILVTGGAGFIGSHLSEKLLGLGHNVLCIDNFDDFYSPDIKQKNLFISRQYKGFELREGDIRDKAFLKETFRSFYPEMVFHLAALPGVWPSVVSPEKYYDVNVMGSLCVMEAMKECDVKKLVFASSSSVYGSNSLLPFAEHHNVDYPISPYAATKKSGELLCHTYHHLYGFDVFCMRFFTTYGLRQRPEMAIAKFTRLIMEGRTLDVYGNGNAKRDYTHIDDIVSGLINTIDKINGYEVINLGESETLSLNELIGLIEQACGKEAIIDYKPPRPGDVDITFADISKARKILSYNPKTSVQEGVNNYVDWYKSNIYAEQV